MQLSCGLIFQKTIPNQLQPLNLRLFQTSPFWSSCQLNGHDTMLLEISCNLYPKVTTHWHCDDINQGLHSPASNRKPIPTGTHTHNPWCEAIPMQMPIWITAQEEARRIPYLAAVECETMQQGMSVSTWPCMELSFKCMDIIRDMEGQVGFESKGDHHLQSDCDYYYYCYSFHTRAMEKIKKQEQCRRKVVQI